MRFARVLSLIFALFFSASLLAQDEPAQTTAPPSDETGAMAGRTTDRTARTAPAPVPEPVPDLPAFRTMLDSLSRASQRTVMDLGALQIDKWKTDRNRKQQAQDHAESLQRNLTAAVPELTQKALAAPGEIAPSFRLYRNMNVLYDVLASVAESADSFGDKDRSARLAADVSEIDSIRRALADRIDTLSAARDSEVASLRAQTHALAQRQANAPVKKVVVDDTKPTTTPKTTPKKKAKPAATPAADSAQKQ